LQGEGASTGAVRKTRGAFSLANCQDTTMAWMHAIEYQRQRWTRPDAERWQKPDPERWLSPEELRLEYPEVYERKYGGLPRRVSAPALASQRPTPANQLIRSDESLRLRALSLLRGAQVQVAMLRHELALRRKANFDPEQPRHPKYSPDSLGGRWRRRDDRLPVTPDTRDDPRPPVLERLKVEKPSLVQLENIVARRLAGALARATRFATPTAFLLSMIQETSWLNANRAAIESYQDPPRTFEQLQDAVSPVSKPGYHDHHIVEQSSKRPGEEARTNARDNLVRIPQFKHEEITAWYNRIDRNGPYGERSPREYLRDKSWEERRSVGLEVLKKFGVLKP
jgi:hypothetical protein